ncbi:MAG: copper amine oxidase N-terminal domain-containing protein [Peptococcaceae bacterium]|jgi:hypothetical protein|nr:copper amine oxidase N-terminal domain-containing protein [Peptococcaceae bacterium]
MKRFLCGAIGLAVFIGAWAPGIWLTGARGNLSAAEEETRIQKQDMAVSRIYLEDTQYLPEGLIEARIGILLRDAGLNPLRRAMVGIASDRPDKDLFYDLDGGLTHWLRTDYDGRVSFMMRTSVEGVPRIAAVVSEDQILWPLSNFLYGYGGGPPELDLVAGKVLEVTLDRNDALRPEGIAPHEEEQRRPFYGAEHVTFYLDSDIMVQDGEILYLDAVPLLKEGVTFLPLRGAAQALGVTVQWDVNFQTAVLTRGDRTLRVRNRDTEMIQYIRGDAQPVSLTANPPPFIDEAKGRMMIPLRAAADAFGAVVWYDQGSRSIHLTQERDAS